MIRLVFIHGWGFDVGFWQDLRSQLKIYRQDVADLGFFGERRNAELSDAIVIGHSYGVQHALPDIEKAKAFISINGFPRFSETSDYQPATPPRLVERMIRRFDAAPASVLEDFRRRCGTDAPWHGTPDFDCLRAGLVELRDGDARGVLRRSAKPILALFGRIDPIVPPEMAAHAFTGSANITAEWHENAGHLLPMSHPAWCAQRIERFCAGIASHE